MTDFDTIIIGGGAAGLAAAMVLVRARRDVLMLDAGHQNNLRVAHSGGVFLHDGENPAALYARALGQLAKYPTFTYRRESVQTVEQIDDLFTVNGTVTAQTVVLAQGVEFATSTIPGVDALWGTKVFNCPFCDGYESRNMRVLGLGSEQWMSHMKAMLPLWIDDLTWADSADIRSLEVAQDGIVATFADGRLEHFDRAFAEQSFSQRSSLADGLGCARDDSGELIQESPGQTSVPGVVVAGDQANAGMQVNIAVASGHTAGVVAVRALLARNLG